MTRLVSIFNSKRETKKDLGFQDFISELDPHFNHNDWPCTRYCHRIDDFIRNEEMVEDCYRIFGSRFRELDMTYENVSTSCHEPSIDHLEILRSLSLTAYNTDVACCSYEIS